MKPINSPSYWKKRVFEFSELKETSKKERVSFYLEFFVSAYLDNKSKIARKLVIPFSEVVFDNPNSPIIDKIVQQYGFYDEKELKRVSEGFYHFYRISQFWDEYWTANYDALHKDIDKRFLIRCAFTFLTLSYPASYTSYLEKNSQSLFSLYDDQVKNLGFSSIAKLMECSLLFCQPGKQLTFPWDSRKLNNPNLIWNHDGMKIYFEDFDEVLNNFFRSGYSMRHEDYSLFMKIQSGVLPLQYSWRRNWTNETFLDKQYINRLIEENTKIYTQSVVPVDKTSEQFSNEEELASLDYLKKEKHDTNAQEIVKLLEMIFILEDLFLHKVLTVDEAEEKKEQLESELKNILSTVTSLDSEVPHDFLQLSSNHLEKFYIYIQQLVMNREKVKPLKPTFSGALSDTSVLEAYQDEQITQAHIAKLQQEQSSELLEQHDSKYKLLEDQYNKQSVLLSNAQQQIQNLKDQLQESVLINSTKQDPTASSIVAAYEEEKRTQAHIAKLQQAQSAESMEQQESKYNSLEDRHLRQTILLSNALEENKKLQEELQASISINTTNKAHRDLIVLAADKEKKQAQALASQLQQAQSDESLEQHGKYKSLEDRHHNQSLLLSNAQEQIQKLQNQLQESTSINLTKDALTDSSILAAYNEEKRTQALIVHLQNANLPEPMALQNSTYTLMKDLHQKQSVLLANALEHNQKLKDQLQESVSINSTKKVLSKYFSESSLDKLFEHLKKSL